MLQARLIAYPPGAAAVMRWVAADAVLSIGRAPDCGMLLDDASVSRAHAEIHRDADGWRLRDLGSKNGSFVDGIRVGDALLDKAACWLRFGDVHCEFALFVDPAQIGLRQQSRHAQSQALLRHMGGQTRFDGLLGDILRGVLELSGCSRGFTLLAKGDGYVVGASRQLDVEALDARRFSGSIGAVQRCLAQRKPIVVNQIEAEPWLAGRASVAGLGLQSLVCVPLLDGDRVLGAVYADRSEPGEPITQLDLELLSAFAESSAVYVLAGRAMEALDGAPSWNTIVSAQTRWGDGA